MKDCAELPTGWTNATLADLGVWSSGGTPNKKKPEYHGGSIPWLLTGDLDDGPIHHVPNAITQAGLDNSSAKLFPTETLLMAMYGATIGKLGILRIEAATNQACAALLPSDANRECLPYIYYFLLLKREDFKKAGKGGAQPNISQTVIKQTPIPVAPRNEQKRIVEKIETLFARLDKGEEAVREVQKLLTRYRQSVLKSAVTGQLTAEWRAERGAKLQHADHLLDELLEDRRSSWKGRGRYKEPVEPVAAELPELPAEWAWASPEQLSKAEANSLCIGPFGSNLKVDDYRDSGVPLVFVRHIRAHDYSGLNLKFVTEEKAAELSSHKVFPGDLLITKMGEPPGDVSIYPADSPTAVITADCIRFSTAGNAAQARYLEIAISSPLVQLQIKKIAKGVAQQKVNLANFKKIAIPLPSSDEQARIVEIVDEAVSKTAALEKWCKTELKRSASLRQSILKDAFAGRLVPQDPSDEPASDLLARIAAEKTPTKKTRRKASA
jgi:type I restriction enzyme S subunit